jgi:hypothetical protein
VTDKLNEANFLLAEVKKLGGLDIANSPDPLAFFREAAFKHLNFPESINFEKLLGVLDIDQQKWKKIQSAAADVNSVNAVFSFPYALDEGNSEYTIESRVLKELEIQNGLYLENEKDIQLFERFEKVAFDFSVLFNSVKHYFSYNNEFIPHFVKRGAPILYWDENECVFKIDGSKFHHAFVGNQAKRPTFSEKKSVFTIN